MPKQFAWVGGSKREFLAFPDEIKDQFGHDLNLVQHSQEPVSSFKHLSSIGSGVIELRENGSPAYRAIYCAKYEDTVYLLHAFEKTTNGTDRQAMKIAKERYQEMMAELKKGP